MYIEEVKIRKFCQHHGDFQLTPGLNAIQGPNGSGKTNFVNAVLFALTGNLTRLHGVKTDNIGWGATNKDRSEVKVTFTHRNAQITIARGIRPGYQEMQIAGVKEPITAAAEIAYKLEELLGINERMLMDYVFVPQWGVFNFIDQQPAVRARAFAELFGAERADQIYQAMGDCKIDIPAPSVEADIVRARLQDNQAELAKVQTSIKLYDFMPEAWQEEEAKQQSIVQLWERKESLRSSSEDFEKRIDAANQRIEAYQFELKPFGKEVASLEQAAQDSEADVEAAKQGLQQWQLYEQAEQMHTVIFNRSQKARKYLEGLLATPPEKPLVAQGANHLEKLKEDLLDAQARIRHYETILGNFKDPKTTYDACPTCGTPVEQINDNLADFEEELNLLRPEAEGLVKGIADWERYNWSCRHYQSEIAQAEKDVQACEQQLQQLPEREKPEQTKEQYSQLISAYEEVLVEIAKKKEAMNIGQSKLLRMEADRDSLIELKAKADHEFSSISTTEKDAKEARRTMEELRRAALERAQLSQRAKDLERLIADDEKALVQFQIVQARAASLRDVAAHLEEVREIYRELPQLVSQYHLEEMRRQINETLEEFSARFRVEAINKLRFILRYSDGRVQPAERLSGGERVMFALAFRIVVNSRFADELGLLCLDEPTSGLDEDNVQCLEIALGRLRELSQARGLQVILITHNRGLDGLFDRVIRLQAAS